MRTERADLLSKLDAAIERGLADADAGRTRAAGEVFDRVEAKYRRLAMPGAAGRERNAAIAPKGAPEAAAQVHQENS